MQPRSSFLVLAVWMTSCSAWGQSGSLLLNLGPVTDRTPPAGTGNINTGPMPPAPGYWNAQTAQREFKLSDYQVTLLNDATMTGLSKPVDGVSLSRIVSQVTPFPGSFIPPSTFHEETRILLVTEDLGLFGPGATISDWNQSFPLASGALLTFNTSSSYYHMGGGPFGGGIGGVVVNASGYDAVIQSFTLTQVPEPGTLALAAVGMAALGWIARRRTGHR